MHHACVHTQVYIALLRLVACIAVLMPSRCGTLTLVSFDRSGICNPVSPHYHDHVDSFQAPKLRQLPRAPFYHPKRKPTPEGSLGRSPKRRGRVLAKPYLIRRHLELHSGCEGSETLATSCKHKFGRVLSRPMIEIQRCGCRQSCLLLARQRNRCENPEFPNHFINHG